MWCVRLRVLHGIQLTAALVVVLLGCVSCAHLETVPSTDANAQQLIGQDIRVTTMDGQILDFRLLDVTEEALVGESRQVRFDDVALLQWRDSSVMKSACLKVGAGAAGLLIALVWFAYELNKNI